MNDEVFYNQIAEEIQAKKMLPGLWTKAFADANGNTELARAFYIKLRVAQLAETERQDSERMRQIQAETERQQASASRKQALAGIHRTGDGFLRVIYYLLIFALGSFSLLVGFLLIMTPFMILDGKSSWGDMFEIGLIEICMILTTWYCIKRAQK